MRLMRLTILLCCVAGFTAAIRPAVAQELETLPSFDSGYAAYERGAYEMAHDIWLVLAKHGDAHF